MKNSNKFFRACADSVCRVLCFYREVLSFDHGTAGVFIKRLLPYGFISSGCRFFPSCSAYAERAIRQYGLATGLMVSCGRILRCHHWSAGGYDPVNKSRCPNPNLQ